MIFRHKKYMLNCSTVTGGQKSPVTCPVGYIFMVMIVAVTLKNYMDLRK